MSSSNKESDTEAKLTTQPESSLDGLEHRHTGPPRGANAVFYPATEMVAKGFSRPLQHDDLWRLHEDERTKSIWKSFKPAWKKQLAKKEPSLFGALAATFKWPLIAAFFLFLLQAALTFTTPVMLPYVIEWLITKIPNTTEIANNFTSSPAFISIISAPIAAPPTNVVAPPSNGTGFPNMNFTLPPFDWTKFIPPSVPPSYIDLAINGPRPAWEGWIYMAVAGGTQILMGLLSTHGFFLTWRTGLKIRVALINLIYRKSLYMAPNKSRDSGAITNLINTDAQLMSETIGFVVIAFLAPFQIAGCVILLARQLGNYAMIPVAAFVFAVPFGGIFGRRLGNLRLKIQAITDMRVRKIKEFITANRIVKYYAWENPIAASVAAVRLAELAVLKTMTLTANGMMFVLLNMPPIGIGLTFFFYGLNNTLTPSLVFTSLSLVNLLRMPFIVLPFAINNIFNYIASLQRIMDFLSKPELPRERPVEETPAPVQPKKHNKKHSKKSKKHGDDNDEKEILQVADDYDWILKIQNGSFKWSPTDPHPVLRNIDMTVSRGQVLMVVGAVGSGKSSLGMAILGELSAVDGAGNLLPAEAQQPVRYRSNSIAYVAQEAWIINGSVRENILFGLPYDEEKYSRTLNAACLGPDLQIMKSGDQTLIGDRGINLSGGQRQRVSIARALYADKDIYLLDDPLSAVDVHVGQAIFELAITEMLIRAGKTVILITNQLQYLPRADMIYMLKKGKVSETGTFNELMAQKGPFAQLINEFGVFNEEKKDKPQKEEKKDNKVAEVKSEASSSSGKIEKVVSEPKSPDVKATTTSQNQEKVEEEERETGPIPFRVFTFFWKQGGAFNTAFILFFSALKLACQIGGYVWLANWSTDMSTSQLSGAQTKYSATVYLWVYLGFLIGESAFSFGGMFGFVLWGVRASKRLHKFLLRAVLRATCAFFDYTPIGRLMSRFSKDMSIIDFFLTAQTEQSLFAGLNLLAIIANFLSGSLWLLLIMIPSLFIYFWVYYIYRHSAVEMQRLEAISRAPVLSNLSETLEGAATIRAYGMISNFKQRAVNTLDENSVDWLGLRYTMTWLSLTLDWLGACVVTIVYLVIVVMRIQGNLDVGLGALALSSTAGFSFLLSQIATTVGDMEIKMNAVERINQYILNVPQEPAEIIEGNRPSASWPKKGRVQFEDLKLAYSVDAGMTTIDSTSAKGKTKAGSSAAEPEAKHEPILVLRGINASIKAKEKVGIVGRTGAGKSTLVSALFRLVEFAGGKLNIDDVNISDIGLFDLRKHLSIVPQQPTLFMGTVRYNLDPFNECTDEDLWRVLEQVRLKEYVTSMEGQLDAAVEENGQNFSVGQRQLLAMARALLRDSRILILDEATAAVDSESDMLIQRMIREDISGDKTVLTIAHRLNTIMDSDRIMVLDKGKVVEFDSPKTLLSNPDGVFTSMVNATGEATAKHLRAVAFGEISVLDSLKQSHAGVVEKRSSKSKSKSTKTPAISIVSEHTSRKDKLKKTKIEAAEQDDKKNTTNKDEEEEEEEEQEEEKEHPKRSHKKGESKKEK